MKRNLLIIPALMVTAFFATTEIAKAADISFSGQILTRYESNENGPNKKNNFDDGSDAGDFVVSRVRLNTNVAVNDSTSAFIQMSRNGTWGSNSGGVSTGANNTGEAVGASNGSFQVSDSDQNLGVHQAYFTLKNFAGLPADLKVGRQQIILDGHRLFGNTIWTVGQQTHDAVRIDHKHDNMSFSAAWIMGSEGGTPGNTDSGVSLDKDIETYMAYMKYSGILGGNLSITYAGIIDPCGTNTATPCTANQDNDMHTIGARQAGQLYGIDYRGEYYYQWGDANQDANALTNGGTAAGLGVDRDAFMFGLRLGKTFKNVNMKPSLTLWYDYLSGTNDDDLANSGGATWKSFNPVFDTGHKYYGLQDLFLGVGTGNETNGTAGLGLQDVAIKTKMSPMPGWTFKADYHWFFTAESVRQNRARAGAADPATGRSAERKGFGASDSSLGNELDLSLSNKYNANTTITAGFSNYTTSAAFRDLRNVIGDGANWAYLMFDVKF
jgi:hypothetical protein